MTEEISGPPGGPGKRRKRALRIALFSVFALFWFVAILVLLLPSLLSSSPGTRFLEKFAGGRIAGSISFERLSLSWRNSQVVDGLVVKDADGLEVLAIDQMVNDRSLWALARSKGEDLGTTTVMGLKADIVADDDGESNLMKALRVPGPAKKKKTGLVPVLPFGSLVLGESRVVVTAPGIDPVVFEFRALNVDLPLAEKPLRVVMDVETRQGDLTGELKVDALAENVVDDRRRLQPLAARINLEAVATNLPVEGLDGAFGFGGVLRGALGSRADLRIKTRADLTKAVIDFSFAAPNLKARLASVFEEGIFSLSEAGAVDFDVTPEFVASLVKRYAPESSLRLENNAPVSVSVGEMRAALLPPELAGTSLAVSAKTAGAMRFSGLADGGELTIKSLEMALDGRTPAEKITVDLSSDLLLNGDPGSARLTAVLSDLLDGSGKVSRDSAKVKLDGTLKNVPAALLEGLAGRDGMMTELVGPSFNAHFTAGNPEKGKTALDFFAESGRFKAETALVIGDSVELVRPVRIQAKLTPRLLDLAGAGPGLIERGSEVVLGITKLSFPLPEEGEVLSPGKIDLEAVATVGPLGVTAEAGGPFDLEGVRVDLKADGRGDIRYTLAARIAPRMRKGELPVGLMHTIMAGEPLAIEVSGGTGFDREGGLGKVTSALKAENSVLHVSAAGEIDGKFSEITMTAPLKADWFAGDTQVANLFLDKAGAYVPRGELKLKARVEPVRLSLKDFSPAAISTSASVDLPRLQIARDGAVEAVIEQLAVRADFDGVAGLLAGTATARAAFPGESRSYPVETAIRLENLVKDGAIDLPGSALTLDLKGRSLPTALAGVLSGGAGWLPHLAGRQADVTALVRKAPLRDGTGEATVEIKAERLQTRADLSLGEHLALKKPMSMSLTLTPASYSALRAGGPDGDGGAFDLAADAVVTGTVSELRLPSGKGGKIGDLSFRAELQSGDLVLKQKKTGRAVGLNNLRVKAAAQPLAKGVTVDIAGAMSDTKGGTGSLEARLALRSLLDGNGSINVGSADLKLDAKAGKIPVALLDGLMGLGGLAEPALGQSLDLTATAALKDGNGPLELKAAATNARLDIAGLLTGGTFTLKKPVVAEVDVTEELGRKLLSKIHPLFETVKTSAEPLRVEIDNGGFAVPLRNFDISAVNMPRLTVASNRMVFRKGGTLEMLVLLANRFGGARGLGSGNEMEVWFTPLVAEMKNGRFSYIRRLDLLIDGRLHAFSWGTVSVAGSSKYDLFLGLPAAALRKILGTKRISESEVFTFPLQGAEGKIDSKGILAKASLDLGRVRGQYELSKKDPLLGLVAGELTKKAIGTDTGPIPPPSVAPLPWAGLFEPEPAPAPPAPAPAKSPSGETGSSGERAAPSKKPAKPQPEEIIKDVLDLFK